MQALRTPHDYVLSSAATVAGVIGALVSVAIARSCRAAATAHSHTRPEPEQQLRAAPARCAGRRTFPRGPAELDVRAG